MKKKKLRITAKKTVCRKFCVFFMNVKLAVAFDRDSGAKVGYSARMLSGEIGSGGSRANWHCYVAEGSVFEVEVDAEFYRKNKNRIKNWKMQEIEEFSLSLDRAKELEQIEANIE